MIIKEKIMKKLFFFFIIVHASLNSMDNNGFEKFKNSVETAINKCTNITENEDRFKEWHPDYANLYNQLPDNPQALDTLLEVAKKEEYSNPVFLFLVHTKRKSSCFDKQFEKFAIQAAQDYGIPLPYTEFTQELWETGNVPTDYGVIIYSPFQDDEKNKDIVLFSGNYIAKLSQVDLSCLDCLPKIKEIILGRFEKMQLTTVPNDLSRLEMLKILTLCYNELTDLPEGLSGLKNLIALSIGYNKFTEVPKVIG